MNTKKNASGSQARTKRSLDRTGLAYNARAKTGATGACLANNDADALNACNFAALASAMTIATAGTGLVLWLL